MSGRGNRSLSEPSSTPDVELQPRSGHTPPGSARRSARREGGASHGSPGAAMEALEHLLELSEVTGQSIHLVCEGAGALLFCVLV